MRKTCTLAQTPLPMSQPDFSTFPEVSKVDWLTAVQQQLKGKDPATLGIEVEGVRIDPFAHPDDRPEGQPPVPVPGRWTVSEQIIVGRDMVAANRQLLDSLTAGCQAPELVLTAAVTAAEIKQLLSGVEPAYVDLHWYDETDDPYLIDELETALGDAWSGTVTNTLRAATGTDKIRLAACRLSTLPAEDRPVTQLIGLVEQTRRCFGTILPPATVAAQLHYRVPIGRKYLVEIAKLRALRILIAQVCGEYGLSGVPLPVIAAYAHPAAFDAQLYTNMIRWGSMALSAAVGGADRIIAPVLPGAEDVGVEFKTRIARNALHLLQLEGSVGKLHDPAAGSFYIEQLTDQLVAAVNERSTGTR